MQKCSYPVFIYLLKQKFLHEMGLVMALIISLLDLRLFTKSVPIAAKVVN
jgi:hypothetical protein